jgi:lysozyme family protein
MVCDFYINAGAKATLLLQQILSAMGQRVVQDGIFGPICLEALAKLPSDEVYRRYKQGRKDYYLGLGHEYPEFLAGWLNRVNTFPDV